MNCGGRQAMGLHQAVALCLHHCADYAVSEPSDAGWYKTIVLAGGSASIPGMPGICAVLKLSVCYW